MNVPATAPLHLREKWRALDEAGLERIKRALVRNCYDDKRFLVSAAGQQDLQAHLIQRLQSDRTLILPWLDDLGPLDGLRILEIGCGTGASTVALAEQGAKVTAIDIEEPAFKVARERCAAYDLDVDFRLVNAVDAPSVFAGEHFDLIIFFATLEHMTHEERMKALRGTWAMLSGGDLWCVVETPNRLWYHDHHTSLLPFFTWLPDQLAFEYARFSPRSNFREIYTENNAAAMLHFLRRGRGVSFHEFELTMKPRAELAIVSCLSLFYRDRNPRESENWARSLAGAYEAVLAQACPDVHKGFLQPSLDLMIRKT